MPARSLTLANRILLGFALTGLLTLALGLYAINQVGRVRATLDAVVRRDMGSLARLEEVQGALSRMVELRTAAVRDLALGAGSVDESRGWTDEVATAQHHITLLQDEVQGYIAVPISAARTVLWQRFAGQLDAMSGSLGQLRGDVERQFVSIRAADRAAMLAQEPRVVDDRRRVLADMTALRATLARIDAAGQAEGARVYAISRASVALFILASVLLGAVIAWLIRRSVIGPLADFAAFSERVGAGDLAAAAATGEDELGRLGRRLNAMVDGLRGLARQSRDATENLNAATTEIRASTQQQAASVEEQLAAIQETAATVDEIAHSGTQISRRAQEVIAAAQATADTGDAGLAAVDGTAAAMDLIRDQAATVAETIVALSEKTQAIGDIISTVNDISERTHLLALNAAIEAAAAGEQGRSFAVVAAEMKGLADQAKDATRQVRGLLGEIQRGIDTSVMLTEEAVKRVAAGKERTDTAQGAIDAMATSIQEATQTFQQIVASTNQQQIGIEQVTLALQNIRQASQQTAASTRQLDHAAGDLTRLSGTLLALVERYRL